MRHLLPCLSILIASSAHAGAWLMPEGDGLAITQLTYFSGNEYWDVNGDTQPQPRYTKWEIQPYVEYGLTEKVTIGGSAYVQRATQSGDQNTGMADPELFFRTRLWKNENHVISIQPLIKLPSRFRHSDAAPRGGSKSTDFELALLYGQNLNIISERDYSDMRIAYRERTRGLAGQYKIDMALGLSPADNWQIIPAIRYTEAAEIDATPFAQTGDLDYDLLKAEVTLAYKLPCDDWVQATIFDHIAGYQTGDGMGASIGYAKRF